jgi:hypothetical protein
MAMIFVSMNKEINVWIGKRGNEKCDGNSISLCSRMVSIPREVCIFTIAILVIEGYKSP